MIKMVFKSIELENRINKFKYIFNNVFKFKKKEKISQFIDDSFIHLNKYIYFKPVNKLYIRKGENKKIV